MSLDDAVPWSVASFLEKEPRDYNRRDWDYWDHLQLTEIESPEAEEARWSSRMAHAARDREVVHYDGSPTWGRPA